MTPGVTGAFVDTAQQAVLKLDGIVSLHRGIFGIPHGIRRRAGGVHKLEPQAD